MDKNENAIIFYGLIQPNKDDKYWIQAAERHDEELEESTPFDSVIPTIAMGSLTAGINFISISSSEEIVYSDVVAIDLDITDLAQHPVTNYRKMLLDYCSKMGIQVYDQEPGWHLALQDNGGIVEGKENFQ